MTKKIYMDNPYLCEIEAKVLLVKEIEGKYHIVLDKTIFYPQGLGGQYGDQGTINGKKIVEAYVNGNTIYHILEENITDDIALVKINWENRLHIMQQHTCQHLVSACFYKLFGIDTLSFHASNEIITIDLDCNELSEEIIEKVEDLANTIIFNNLDIKWYFPSEEEIKDIKFRRRPKVKDNLRVIEIDGFDFSVCGGTHVNTTGQIGLIKIIDSYKQNGKTRISLFCGFDAIKDYQTKDKIISHINKDLSANTSIILEKYNNLKTQTQELKDNFTKLKKQLLDKIKDEIILEKHNSNSKIVVKNIEDIGFDSSSLLLKKLENQNIILAFYEIEDSISKFIIKVGGNLDFTLDEIRSVLKENFDLKGGGNSKQLQGLILNSTQEKISTFFEKTLVDLCK